MRPKVWKPKISRESLLVLVVVSLLVFLSFLLQRSVKTVVSTEDAAWAPTDVCVPTASPAPSANEVTGATLAVLCIAHTVSMLYILAGNGRQLNLCHQHQ